MALTLPRWIMAAALGCTLITTAVIVHDGRDRSYRVRTEPTPERRTLLRVHAQYVRTHHRWRSLARRDSILATLTPGRAPVAGPLVRTGTSVWPETRVAVERLVRRQWSALGIDSAHAPVVVALVREQARAAAGTSAVSRGTVAFDYIIPPAGSDGPCVAVVVLGSPRGEETPPPKLTRILGDPDYTPFVLGPCAFYARFGRPGPAVDEWLSSRRYDLVHLPAWTPDAGTTGSGDQSWRRYSVRMWDELGYNAYASADWERPSLRACLVGHLEVCESIVAPQRGGGSKHNIVARRVVDGSGSAFAPEAYLSDLVSFVGPERFTTLWRSSGTISTAMLDATGVSIGEWTHIWGRAYYPATPRVGPAVGLVEGTIAVGLMIIGVVSACLIAHRRQLP